MLDLAAIPILVLSLVVEEVGSTLTARAPVAAVRHMAMATGAELEDRGKTRMTWKTDMKE